MPETTGLPEEVVATWPGGAESLEEEVTLGLGLEG